MFRVDLISLKYPVWNSCTHKNVPF